MRFICFVLFLILSMFLVGQSAANENQLHEDISKNEQFSGLSQICPAELVKGEDIDFYNLTSECEENPNLCYKRCVRGSSDHCFGLANHFNISDENSTAYSRPLYAKSCQLGLASSCTNVAAGLKNQFGLDEALCYTRTFEKTCELDDPWGCTMYAVSLIYGEGTEKDLDKALSVMRGSCRFGEGDRACSTALELTSEIIKGEFDEK